MMRRVLILCLLAGFAAPPLAAADDDWSWTIPDDMTLEATGPSGRDVTFTVTARWKDKDATVTCAPASGSTFGIGRTTVECKAQWESHVDERDFDITVQDTTPPDVTVPANMTVDTPDPSGANVSFSAAASDLVDGTRTVSCTPASGARFSLGTHHVSCSASDTRGNSATQGFDVTVNYTGDDPPRVTVSPDMTVEAESLAGATVTYTASAEDSRGGTIPVTCSPASGSTFRIGPTTVTCTATDRGETTRRFTITVADRTPPTVSVPPSRVVRTTHRRGAIVTFRATATDLVDGAVGTACSVASGARFAYGVTKVACTAADRRGNVGAASFNVTVAHLRTAKRLTLLAPLAGARVSAPPMLRWRAVPKARFYNVQVYRNGRKILSFWPSRSRLRMTRSWQHDGRTFRLKPAVYTWYVWPGFGTLASPRYGKMLGKSSFRVV